MGQGVAHVLGFDFVLVVLGVHEHIHRVGEVGVGALLLVRMIWSILSSALKTTSVPLLFSRLLSFMRTVAALRPPRLYSVFRTTIGSLPCMMTLPARIS